VICGNHVGEGAVFMGGLHDGHFGIRLNANRLTTGPNIEEPLFEWDDTGRECSSRSFIWNSESSLYVLVSFHSIWWHATI
jgi:hypothetical protein